MENRKVRLIDANELLDRVNKIQAGPAIARYTEGFIVAIMKFRSMIHGAPTIGPESLRPHGEWIWDEENECWVCSNCESSALNNYRGNSTDSNYCPNCGAVMQGVKDE